MASRGPVERGSFLNVTLVTFEVSHFIVDYSKEYSKNRTVNPKKTSVPALSDAGCIKKFHSSCTLLSFFDTIFFVLQLLFH